LPTNGFRDAPAPRDADFEVQIRRLVVSAAS